MKPIQVADDILPIAEFKAHVSAVVRKLRQRGRPVVITQNGKPAAVIMSAGDFDRLTRQARFVDSVNEGLEDSLAGRIVSDEDLAIELARRLGGARR